MKNVKAFLQSGSIRVRLTLFYTAAMFILLGIFALFLYWVTMTILYKADYEFLSDEVETIQYILVNKSLDRTALKQAVIDAPIHPDSNFYRYYIRVFDRKKQVMIETPGMTNVLEAKKYADKHVEQLGKKRYFWYSNNKHDYLLIQSPIQFGSKKQTGLIQVALDVSYQHNVIKDRKNLVIFLLSTILASLLIGFLIANRGMRSLYLLTEAVQKITATSLNQRLNPNSWPKELRGLGIAFNQMLDRIETSFTRLKQFSADLSHEMRTPITNLIGETEIALAYDHSIEKYREVMESNLEELQRISTLIENILFLARAENPQIELKKSPLDMRREIMLVIEFYQAMLDEKHIQVFIDGDSSVTVNTDMFRRMISNLLSNTIKYTPPHSIVRFTICDIDKKYVRLTMQDNGMGIAKEHLPKIFDRFFRVDTSRTTSGMGLGLPIVKSIVELHHGAIDLISDIGKGVAITITLPK